MRKAIRIFSLWVLPFLVLILLSLTAFIWWCFASNAGTKWLLEAAAVQLNGAAQEVRGSILNGVYVKNFNIDIEPVKLELADLHLKVLWPELFRQRRLHINDLSAATISLDLPATEAADDSATEEFNLPALPIGIELDRLALNGLDLNIGGQAVPIGLLALDLSASLNQDLARLNINQFQLAQNDLLLQLNGAARVPKLAKPWPLELKINGLLQAQGQDQPVCPHQVLQYGDSADSSCAIDLVLTANGDLNNILLNIDASGDGLKLAANSSLYPLRGMPLGTTKLDLSLPDDAGISLNLTTKDKTPDLNTVALDLAVRKLALNKWLPANIGASSLNFVSRLNASLGADYSLHDLSFGLDFKKGNSWNGNALLGHLNLASLKRTAGVIWPIVNDSAADHSELGLDNIQLNGLNVDLKLGHASVFVAGDLALADSKLALSVAMPSLALAWPDLPGGLNLDGVVYGNLQDFKGGLQTRYIIDQTDSEQPLKAPVGLELGFSAGLDNSNNWHAQIQKLRLDHAMAHLLNKNNIDLEYDATGKWSLGNTRLALGLQQENLVDINLQKTGGKGSAWFTQGALSNLFIDAKKIEQVRKWFATDTEDKGSIKVDQKLSDDVLELGLSWNLSYDEVFAGNIKLQRVAGDITVPTDIPVKLNLANAVLSLDIKPQGASRSQLMADLVLDTNKMGSLRLRADTPLHLLPEGGFALVENDVKNIHLQAESEDLAWVNLFLDGAQEIGGTITADIKGTARNYSKWNLSGPLTGKNLSLVIPDQGVRLLDGSLAAHFEGMKLALDKLHFPATQRVIPKEERTKTWLTTDADAQNGYLDISGTADLESLDTDIKVDLHRYPVIQRSDRYVMLSGDLAVNVGMPNVVIGGALTVDAGWFDIDMLNDIPELSSDVVIIRRGETLPEEEPSLVDIKADISIDMGQRFFVTGYGLDTGVVGQMDIHLKQNKLRALGALRTRGGGIEAYGQSLKLRRGRITFQGDITNPVLDIEALRTDVTVQAGVGITGSARAPKIGLVSYPEVSETEKISWLLLGHGPDADGGGDMTLLFSVGSSFLSGGEPFYKRFGLDELSMRSGELGSTGSILPVESVVTAMDAGASPIEQRFIVAGKQVSKNVRLSLEQALAQTGTVARLSYKLMWRLQSEFTVGTTNGLALVYRWFSLD